jgi:hypothetical protein
MMKIVKAVILLMACSAYAHTIKSQPSISGQALEAVRALTATLTEEEKKEVFYDFQHQGRTEWTYLPVQRKGLMFRNMSPRQREQVKDLLQVVLSAQGLQKLQDIMALEAVLKRLENRDAGDDYRDPERYYLSIFGNPSAEEPWFFRFEGHHISINVTVTSDQVSVLPNFFGANPAVVPSGEKKGLQVLREEEEMARTLLAALDEEQARTAIISDHAPDDIVTRTESKITLQDAEGISMSALRKGQQELLQRLIHLYLERMDASIAEPRKKELQEAGWENIHFAWAGSTEKGKRHYYKIQGPTMLIEYDNTQNDANHVHTVWRDAHNDFGYDILSDHYKNHQHDGHGH